LEEFPNIALVEFGISAYKDKWPKVCFKNTKVCIYTKNNSSTSRLGILDLADNTGVKDTIQVAE
jgi:hypothetical protein